MFGVVVLMVSIYLLLVASLEVGHWVRMRREARDDRKDGHGGMVTTFTLSLLSLILAFNLNSARDSFSRQQELEIHEARAIHEAAVTSRMLNEDSTAAMLEGLAELIRQRRAYNASLSLTSDYSPREAFMRSQDVLFDLFKVVTAMPSSEPGAEHRPAVLAKLSEIREVTAERWVIENNQESWFPSFLTTVLAIISGILVGQSLTGSRRDQRGYRIAFALCASLCIALIADFENPRLGAVRVDFVDKLLEQPL